MLNNKRQRTLTPEEEYHHQNRLEEALRMIEELEQEMHKKDMENVVMRIELERLHSETYVQAVKMDELTAENIAMKEIFEAREGDKDEDMAEEDENDVDGQYSFDKLDSIPNYQMRNDDDGMRLFDEMDKLCGFPSEKVDEDGGSEEFVDAGNTQRLFKELDDLFDCLVSNEQVEEAGDNRLVEEAGDDRHVEDAKDNRDVDEFEDALDSFDNMDAFVGYKRENVEFEVAKDPQPSLDIDIFLRKFEKDSQ